MLEILQTGKALYALAAIGIIGVLSKLVTRSLYKRLIRETDNMAATKNKNLKILKQKLENACRLNQDHCEHPGLSGTSDVRVSVYEGFSSELE